MTRPIESSLVQRDRARVWHPYTQMLTAPPPIPIVRGEGVFLFTEDGRKILDGISSWWVNIHGHSHPHLNAALTAQAAQLEHVLFAGFTHEPAVALAEELVALMPAGLTRVFYSDNGSTAVEVALKMAWQYWRNRGEDDRRLFIAMEHAYHGDTVGAMSASASSPFTVPFEALCFAVERVPAPYAYQMRLGPEECARVCLEVLQRTLETKGSEVAAVIIEPMLQAAGGMIVWPVEYLRGVRDLCNRYEVLLIADEVMTGFGRTGKMFACEHAEVAPDLICLSKGLTGGYLPLAATIASESIYEAFLSDDRTRTFFHGHSYTANPLGCAVALASLELFRTEGTLDRVGRLEQLLTSRFQSMKGYPQAGDVRGIGGVAAIELVRDKESRAAGGYLDRAGPALAAEFLRRGLLLRPLGNVLYFMPPLSISDDDANWACDQIDEVLRVWRWP